MHILNRETIEGLLNGVDLSFLISKGFIAYSSGQVVVPPIGELSFKDPPGDVHIKYGYIKGDKYYVIKIASGFWENEKHGIPNGQGMMLLFNQNTGVPEALLHDEAILTDIRTAIAGQICASMLANEIHCIGIIGTGVQARLQVEYLQNITKCREIMVWGRNVDKVRKYKKEMERKGFTVFIKTNTKDICKGCNLIITTTASKNPIIFKDDLQPGTHITAVGADAIGKRELGDGVLGLADTVVADSVAQCIERGEISHALSAREIKTKQICELGHILSGKSIGRKNREHITIADLTGVAVQDVQIATAVFESYLEKNQMKFEQFELERNQSLFENEVDFNLSESGVHPLKLSEILTEEEQKEILHTELFYGYTNGTPELRQRVADIYGNQFSKENVLITSGSAEANFLSVMTQLDSGDEIIYMVPNYLQIFHLARSFGIKVNILPIRQELGWQWDPDELQGSDKCKNKNDCSL